MNLFASPTESQNKSVLVEFKAGMMEQEKDSKWVRPIKRKGLVSLKKQDDQLVHFMWKDRTTATIEHDLIVFPGDAEFRKVMEAKGRVYLLDFKTSNKKLFFWMQDIKDDKDDENCSNLNKFMNNPNATTEESTSGGRGGISASALSSLLGVSADNGDDGSSPAHLSVSNLQSILSALNGSASASPLSTSTTDTTATATSTTNTIGTSTSPVTQEKGPSLSDVVDTDDLISSGLFDNKEVVNKLIEFLPPMEGSDEAEKKERGVEYLKANIQSPQFQQAVRLFNSALNSGELQTIMASFQLSPSDFTSGSTLEDFLKAIQKKSQEGVDEDKMDTS
jgi:hypothetical protein